MSASVCYTLEMNHEAGQRLLSSEEGPREDQRHMRRSTPDAASVNGVGKNEMGDQGTERLGAT